MNIDYSYSRNGMLVEYNDLVVRLNKLKAFLCTAQFNELDIIDCQLLTEQSAFMEGYRRTLAHRITRAGGNGEDSL
jgi:hypothetical protein